jgi:hypothetical protein
MRTGGLLDLDVNDALDVTPPIRSPLQKNRRDDDQARYAPDDTHHQYKVHSETPLQKNHRDGDHRDQTPHETHRYCRMHCETTYSRLNQCGGM